MMISAAAGGLLGSLGAGLGVGGGGGGVIHSALGEKIEKGVDEDVVQVRCSAECVLYTLSRSPC